MDEVVTIEMTQEDIDEIESMTDPEDIKDFLSVMILCNLSDPAEVMKAISSRPETLH